MENEQANINIERRSGADRRDDSEAFDFPFIDSHGHLVTEDRRKYHITGAVHQQVVTLKDAIPA